MTTSIHREVPGPESRVPSPRRGSPSLPLGLRFGGAGFTLLELILVMGILFVLASVVAPRFSDFLPSLRVRKTGDRIYAWAQKTRADAATTGTVRRLVFDTKDRTYHIEVEANPFRNPGKFTVLGGGWEAEALPDGVDFETLEGLEAGSGGSTVRFLEFRPDGTSEDAKIVIANDREDRVTIRVVGATSKLTIERPAAPR